LIELVNFDDDNISATDAVVTITDEFILDCKLFELDIFTVESIKFPF
jgi:hypothetical protein